jgi:hypothetical protein
MTVTPLGNVPGAVVRRLAKSVTASRVAYASHGDIVKSWKKESPSQLGIPLRATATLFERVSHPPHLLTGGGSCSGGRSGRSSGRSGCDAYVWVDNESLVVAVRGTTDRLDVMANLQLEAFVDDDDDDWDADVGDGGAMVHRGFAAQYTAMRSKLYDHIDALKRRHVISAIHCTGHSLGGAVATLCALGFDKDDLPVTLHAFGTPRVGNRAFAALARAGGLGGKLEENIRVQHKLDVVTYLPWHRVHVGDEVSITRVNPAYLLWPVEFHSCDNYLAWVHDAADAADGPHHSAYNSRLRR